MKSVLSATERTLSSFSRKPSPPSLHQPCKMELPSHSSTITDVVPQKSRLRKALAIFQRSWIRYAGLALLGLAVRFPALPGELIWDDTFLARDNPFIRSPVLIFEAFRHHL